MECTTGRTGNYTRTLANSIWAKCIITLSSRHSVYCIYVCCINWQRSSVMGIHIVSLLANSIQMLIKAAFNIFVFCYGDLEQNHYEHHQMYSLSIWHFAIFWWWQKHQYLSIIHLIVAMHWAIWDVKSLLLWVHFRVLELQLPMHASPMTGMAHKHKTTFSCIAYPNESLIISSF